MPQVRKKYFMQSYAYKAALLMALVTTTLYLYSEASGFWECAPASRKPAAVGLGLKQPLNPDEPKAVPKSMCTVQLQW